MLTMQLQRQKPMPTRKQMPYKESNIYSHGNHKKQNKTIHRKHRFRRDGMAMLETSKYIKKTGPNCLNLFESRKSIILTI